MPSEGSARVVNRHKEEFDVYIGRGSKWGNPYSHSPGTKAEHVVADRGAAVASFRIHLWHSLQTGLITEDELLALDGKRLGCYCAPQACHGDVLVAAINWIKSRRKQDAAT